jgi:hypothetical protein
VSKSPKDVQRRLNLLFDIRNDILTRWESGEPLTREDIIRILKQEYEKERISPLRGASMPEDIYDKEMASLYVVGKYGMGLDDQYPDLFDKIFYLESKYDHIAEILLTEPPEKARDLVTALVGGQLEDNTVARILRIRFTMVYFGFADEQSLKALGDALRRVFPEKEKIVSKYLRFYIAFKVATSIYRGEIRDRLSKEALKQGTALAFDPFQGTIPDDKYIRKIASEVFRVPRKVLDSVLSRTRPHRRSRQKQSQSQ